MTSWFQARRSAKLSYILGPQNATVSVGFCGVTLVLATRLGYNVTNSLGYKALGLPGLEPGTKGL